MKASFISSFFLTCFLTNSFCQIPIGNYSTGGVFSNQTLDLRENNQFEYSSGYCDGGSYGKGKYEISDGLICLYFQGPERDLKETKITKLANSKDSLIICFTDKFKQLKSIEFSGLTKTNKKIDTALKTGLTNFIKFPRSYLPVKLNFYNLELIDCPLTFNKTGIFWIEVSVTKEMIAKKLNYQMINDTIIVYQYTLTEKPGLRLNKFYSKYPIDLYHR